MRYELAVLAIRDDDEEEVIKARRYVTTDLEKLCRKGSNHQIAESIKITLAGAHMAAAEYLQGDKIGGDARIGDVINEIVPDQAAIVPDTGADGN